MCDRVCVIRMKQHEAIYGRATQDFNSQTHLQPEITLSTQS